MSLETKRILIIVAVVITIIGLFVGYQLLKRKKNELKNNDATPKSKPSNDVPVSSNMSDKTLLNIAEEKGFMSDAESIAKDIYSARGVFWDEDEKALTALRKANNAYKIAAVENKFLSIQTNSRNPTKLESYLSFMDADNYVKALDIIKESRLNKTF